MQENIPVIDYQRYCAGGAGQDDYVETLGRGLEEFGFVAIVNHGVSDRLIAECYDAARLFFALEEDAKRVAEDAAHGHQRGYTPFGLEHAKDRAVPDLKEFFHVGRDLGPNHPLTLAGDVPPNCFSDAVPEFRCASTALFDALDQFSMELLDAIDLFLGHELGRFRAMVSDGNSVLRIIHYPDIGEVPAGAVRAAAHEDINLITLLPASTRPGLELMTRDGQWMAVNTPPGALICDTGDMMQLFTDGRLNATTHRVVNPERADGGRLSMPFFVHPHPDALLSPAREGERDAIRTRDFFTHRMQETGVA